jgi:hypothetical protein
MFEDETLPCIENKSALYSFKKVGDDEDHERAMASEQELRDMPSDAKRDIANT